MTGLSHLAFEMMRPATRPAAVHSAASLLHAEELLLFIRDSHGRYGVLPGWTGSQDGRVWQAELWDAARRGKTFFATDDGRIAHAFACADHSVLVLLGGLPPTDEVKSLTDLLPFVVAALLGETTLRPGDGHGGHPDHDERELDHLREALIDRQIRLEETLLEARERDRLKDEFLAMLGHELRNPLAVVSTVLENLRHGHDDKALDIAQRHLGHLSRLTDDLLDVARITQHKVQLRRAPARISELVQHALESARTQDGGRHQVEVRIPDEPIWLDVDAVRVEQVIANLLSNAFKYSAAQSQVVVDVNLVGAQMVLRVVNQGSGISAALLPKIFDLFVQSERTLDRSQGGLGVGLTLVRSLIDAHDGTVTASSAGPGKGTTFEVRLSTCAPPQTSNSSASPGATPGKAHRVLVVDDNVDIADMLGRLIALRGHAVTVAYNGQEALERSAGGSFNLVLLDIGLPGIDGYEVARRLRARGARTHLVALTGYGQDADRRRAESAGFDGFESKPIGMKRLAEILEHLP